MLGGDTERVGRSNPLPGVPPWAVRLAPLISSELNSTQLSAVRCVVRPRKLQLFRADHGEAFDSRARRRGAC